MRAAYAVVLGFAVIGGLVAVNWWAFPHLLGRPYLSWYIDNGAGIALVTAIVGMVWKDLDGEIDFISAHPLRYLAASARVIALPPFVVGTHLRSNRDRGANADETPPRSALDILLSVPFALVLCLAVVAWFLVIVPLQYFVYLIAGAPGRLFAASDWRVIVRSGLRNVEFREVNKNDPIPDGWWDASLHNRPVAVTSMFASLLLLLAGHLAA
jgi:hypothetical protein